MRAQVSMEAIIVLLAFTVILICLASFEISHGKKADHYMKELQARAVAEKCAQIIDAMSANPGSIAKTKNEKCYGTGSSIIYYSDGNITAGAGTVAGKIETIGKHGGFVGRLENETHYS